MYRGLPSPPISMSRLGCGSGLGDGWSPYLGLAALIPLFPGAGNVYRTIAWARGGLDPAPLAMIPGLVALQVVAATVMYLFLFRLQAVGGPTYFSQIGYVAAAFAAVIGVGVLGERYPPMVWAGAWVVAAGIAITTLAQRRERR